MTRRRTLAPLVTAALLVAAPLTWALEAGEASAASDDTPGYSVRAIEVDVLTGPGRDIPCTLVADLYTPDGASRTNPAPAVLTTNGFGGSKDNAEQRSYAQGFAMEGYVVLSYSGLGFGGSTCKISLDDPDYDGAAGSQMVDVLAGSRPFRDGTTGEAGTVRTVATERRGDPRVGMIGGSYGGQIQYAVAMQDTRIDALIPMFTWNDLAYSLAPNNTDFAQGVSYRTPGVHKRIWTTGFFASGIQNGVAQFQADPTRLVGCPNFLDQICTAKATLETTGYPDQATLDLARHASVASYIDRITVPTLVVQGQKDTLFNLQESVATYRALRANGVESRLVWQSFGHSDSTPQPGEYDRSGENVSFRSTYLGRRFLAWMDHWVRGDESAPLGPRFAYHRAWVDTDGVPGPAWKKARAAYADADRFHQRQTARLFLTGADGLTDERSQVVDGAASYANVPGAATSYSETSALEGGTVDNPVSDQDGTFVAYTSTPLARPLDVVGAPRVTLRLDAPVASGSQAAGPAGQVVLFAKVYDVAPDGTPTLKNRLVSPVRVADVTKPVRIELPGVVHRFAKGHRIRLVIAASDFSYAGNSTTQPVTVLTDPSAPGILTLPALSPLHLRISPDL